MEINGNSGNNGRIEPKPIKCTSELNNKNAKNSAAQEEAKVKSSSTLKEASQKLFNLKSTIMRLSPEEFNALNKEIEKYLEMQAELAKEIAAKYIDAQKYFYSLDFVRNLANSYAPEDEAWAEYIKFIDKAFNTPMEIEELEKLINEVK